MERAVGNQGNNRGNFPQPIGNDDGLVGQGEPNDAGLQAVPPLELQRLFLNAQLPAVNIAYAELRGADFRNANLYGIFIRVNPVVQFQGQQGMPPSPRR